ncbi:7639_t:CDS:10 [Ambispora leptoticha]|uniref:7639_t:CDS:1 n=1 Tax=Ambispora leptoticha TaxID=144679 RepID=A0A9N9B485_9GLOM|nr:7639_t:CDS:10 [Ambispora leptoticha]
MSGGNIKVVVRCRPLNSRELARGAKSLIRMEGNQTIIYRPASDDPGNAKAAKREDTEEFKAFTFDKSYWSADKSSPNYATQAHLYNDLGEELLDHSFDGYNTCIFAYGQTGAGKSYSMMGYGEDKGIIPLTCCELFNRITRNTDPNVKYQVEVSYIEIYNERVRDLLNPKNKDKNLKVREHPSLGPYVEDLSKLIVNSFQDIENLMDEGNKARTVAATNMNETSSRSHAVFTLLLTQKRHDPETKMDSEKVSRISLVDLAGSERANSTGATGARLKEGANINKSLTTLGKVIAALAEQSAPGSKKGKKGAETFVPYRDSVLTWLLKDSLGGNSKTAMIAAISPADYDETLSTLRYADAAKKIKNKAVVNEDPNAKLIRELKEELAMLRNKIGITEGGGGGGLAESETTYDPSIPPSKQVVLLQDKEGNTIKKTKEEIIEQIEASQKLMTEINETWEEKLRRTEEIQKEREKTLEELGIMVEKNAVGVSPPKKVPHLVNLNEDPLMSECLVYQIKQGITRVGRLESDVPADIRLSGENILEEHCYFENKEGVVTLHPSPNSTTMVNGIRINKTRRLKSGFRIILGDFHVFRFNHPDEVRKERAKSKNLSISINTNMISNANGEESGKAPDSPTSTASILSEAVIDWNYAKREAAMNYLNFGPELVGNMPDEELTRLMEEIRKIQGTRRTRPDSRSGDFDDDTESRSSDKPGSNGTYETNDTVYTTDSPQSDTDEKLRTIKEEMQMQLDLQKQEYEEKMRLIEASNLEADELKAEKKQMEEKLKMLQGEMQRVLEVQALEYQRKLKRLSTANLEGFQLPLDIPPYTEEELQLIHMVIKKWKRQRFVHMAETILSNAVVLKEANVISKELGKKVLYQFTIIEEEPFTNPVSFYENRSATSQLNNINGNNNEKDIAIFVNGSTEDTSLYASKKPCVGVKVIDTKNNTVYIWSLDKLKNNLQKMRNLYNFIDRPQYSKHFNWEDPFYENPPPQFTFIGSAAIGLTCLLWKTEHEQEVPVFQRYSGKELGSCLIRIKFLSESKASSPLESESESTTSKLSVGSSVVFEVKIIELKGIPESEFTQVHVQFKLSSFGTIPHLSPGEHIYTTDLMSEFGDTPIRFNYEQTLSVAVTPEMMNVLTNGMLTFEVFGRAEPAVLTFMERWDDPNERQNHKGINGNSHESTPRERRSDDELVAEEKHDIVAWVKVCELAPSGDYVPVQVLSQNTLDPGAFFLRQGLQRRIILTLTHNSGHQFPWNRVTRMEIGRVRLLDGKGRLAESPVQNDIEMKMLPSQTVQFNGDGTSVLSAQASWDSTLHDSIFLNRTTDSKSRVLLGLTWYVEAEKCVEPICFSMDIAVQIQGREARPPSKLIQLLNQSKVLWKSSGLFSVTLKPPMTRKISELWRLNTASKYVRGEEFLGSWKPRGISLIKDFKKINECIQKRESVEFTKQVIKLREICQSANGSKHVFGTSDPEELVKRTYDLWIKKWGTSKEIVINQEPPLSGPYPDAEINRYVKTPTKLVAQVRMVGKTDTITKKGYLYSPENAYADWVKRWYVLRRPYLFIYESQKETEEQGVVNLTSVRVDYKKDVELILERKFVFSIFTNNNSYVLQASSKQDMIDWISKIDQFFNLEDVEASKNQKVTTQN